MNADSELRRWAIEQASAAGAKNVAEEAQKILEFMSVPPPSPKARAGRTKKPLSVKMQAHLVRMRAIRQANIAARKALT